MISLRSGVAVMSTVLPSRSTTKCKRLVGAHADDALHLAEALDGLAVDADDAVARQEASSLRGAAGSDDVDLRRSDALAEDAEDHGEDDDREHEIGDRSGGDDGRALAERLALEAVRPLLGRLISVLGRFLPALAAFSSSMNLT